MSTLLQKSSKKSLIREYGEALLVALVLAFVIRTFVVQAYKIPSESMVETLLVGDHLLASKFAYGIKIPFTHSYIYRGDDPAYGDIIIFEYPNDPSTSSASSACPATSSPCVTSVFTATACPWKKSTSATSSPTSSSPSATTSGP